MNCFFTRLCFLSFSTLVFLVCFSNQLLKAQVGIGTATPNAQSILELQSPDKGFLPPRMDNAARATLGALLTAAHDGMLVYDTNDQALYFWDGSLLDWVAFSTGGVTGSGTANQYAKWNGSGLTNALLSDDGTTVSAGVGAVSSSAILQLNSTTQGALLPRMTTAQRDAIVSPAEGLLIYNTLVNRFQYYNGTFWVDGSANNLWKLSGNANTNPLTDFIGTTDINPLIIKTNSTTRMVVGSGGLIQMGTTNSTANLNVLNSAAIDGADANVSLHLLNASSATTRTPNLKIENFTGGFGGAGAVNFQSSGGSLGTPATLGATQSIGKTNYLAHTGAIYATVATIEAQTGSNFSGADREGVLIFRTSNNVTLAEQMRINQNGLVGIGQNNPTERLDVLGNVKFSGALMPNNLAGNSGEVLTSAGAGSPPVWQSITGMPSGVLGNTLRNNGGSWVADNALYNDGTNIGINYTGSFISRLHVVAGSAEHGIIGQTYFDGYNGVYGIQEANGSAIRGEHKGSGLGIGVEGATSSGTGTGVQGEALRSSGVSFGVRGLTASDEGTGVFGYASSTTGFTYGALGQAESPDGIGVFGYNTATSGTAIGVQGVTDSDDGIAIFGVSNANTSINYGVHGIANSSLGIGIYGLNQAASGVAIGVKGESQTDQGIGVYGYNETPTGLTYGVYGQVASSTGVGVYGNSTRSTGVTYGVRGQTASTSGIAVEGLAKGSSGATIGVNAKSESSAGTGLVAYASSASGNTYGVNSRVDSPNGISVYSLANSTTGPNYGVYSETKSNAGTAIFGVGSATSGINYGVVGQAYSPTGVALRGDNLATSGSALGVYGSTASSVGTAVSGFAGSTTAGGNAKGISGQSDAPLGYGVYGYAGHPTGVNYGVFGKTASSAGYGIYGEGVTSYAGYFYRNNASNSNPVLEAAAANAADNRPTFVVRQAGVANALETYVKGLPEFTIDNNGNAVIGNNTATHKLHVEKIGATNNSAVYIASLNYYTSSGTGANGIGNGVLFRNEDSAGSLSNTAGLISSLDNATSGSLSGSMSFSTIGSFGFSEKMKIFGNGRVAIENNPGAPDHQLVVNAPTGTDPLIIRSSGSGYLRMINGGKVGIGAYFTPGTSLDLMGDFAMRRVEGGSLSGTFNGFATNNSSYYGVNCIANTTINGMTGGTDGKIFILYNRGAFNLTFNNLSGAAAAGNRIVTMSGGAVTSAGAGSFTFYYDINEDGGNGAWLMISFNP